MKVLETVAGGPSGKRSSGELAISRTTTPRRSDTLRTQSRSTTLCRS